MNPDEQLEKAIIAKIRNLKKKGRDILGGTFTACNGNVTLDIYSQKLHYQITYCCYGRMWIFKILKKEIE